MGQGFLPLIALSAWVLLITIVSAPFTTLAADFGTTLTTPYMDEIFHIPQAQRVCRHFLENNTHAIQWDSKITTLPGVYLLSTFFAKLGLGRLGDASNIIDIVCSSSALRMHNMAMAVMLAVVLYNTRKVLLLTSRAKAKAGDESRGLMGIQVDCILISAMGALWPVSGLYYFLYYTDTAASLSLLLTYYLLLRALQYTDYLYMLLLFLAASLSILCRQTNAVWIAFLAGISVLKAMEASGVYDDDDGDGDEFALALLRNANRIFIQSKYSSIIWPIFIPVVLFAYFVIAINHGSVVVGDQSAHEPVLHFAMPFHGLALLCCPLAPQALYYYFTSSNNDKKNKESNRILMHCFGSLFCGFALLKGSYAHSYLVSDNRHYMFYIWQRYLQHDRMRFTLGCAYYPLYRLVRYMTSGMNVGNVGPMWKVGYAIACAATLIPTPLLEPRYFTSAVLFGLLHSPSLIILNTGKNSDGTINDEENDSVFLMLRHRVGLLLSVLIMALVTSTVIHVFLYRSFLWSDGTIARFLW
eukprot:GSChrysophyteH1.ASY1.ANO1.2850.1 assembled CDS